MNERQKIIVEVSTQILVSQFSQIKLWLADNTFVEKMGERAIEIARHLIEEVEKP